MQRRRYLDDAVLPGVGVLKKAGIETALCVLPSQGDRLLDDARTYLDFQAFVENGLSIKRPTCLLTSFMLQLQHKTGQPFFVGDCF
jgi:hypothetical protein